MIRELKSGAASYVDKVSYTYDALGQLKTEINVDLGQKIIYTYDSGGNITSKSIYAYTNGTVGALQNTVNYTYDGVWKDKLTNYDGDSITYDQIGNPLTYRNGMSFTWNGRQMATANLNGTAVTYKYDADGLRNYKKVGNTVHEYEYVGGQLVYEKRGDLKFYYRYNAMGELASIKRINSSGTEYTVYVVTNTRGDVEELWLASGTMVARYVYDTWGNTIGILDDEGNQITDTSSIAVQNPLRYRSYYYDAESGLYYLQSRYYDPVVGRFISADGQMAGVGDSVQGYNLYAYCFNDPVNASDSEGEWPSWAKKAVAAFGVVAAVAVVAAVTVATAGTGTAAALIAVGAAKGAAIGMASGAAIGAATGAVSHRVSTGSWSGAGTAALNGMGDGALLGAVTGAITGAAGSAVKVSQAAKAWDSGTFKSGYQSMKYHYNKHVVSEGLTKGNNVLKYTQDAVSFANRNSSVLKYTYNYNYGNASWNLTYSTGQGGMFTSAGKILTFWYR